jgi:hypothetical protein
LILCKNNPCHWACFQNVKKQKGKKTSFFGSAYLTATSTNYARRQRNSLLVKIWRLKLVIDYKNKSLNVSNIKIVKKNLFSILKIWKFENFGGKIFFTVFIFRVLIA